MKQYDLEIFLTCGERFCCKVMAHSLGDAEEAVKPLIRRMLGFRSYRITEVE